MAEEKERLPEVPEGEEVIEIKEMPPTEEADKTMASAEGDVPPAGETEAAKEEETVDPIRELTERLAACERDLAMEREARRAAEELALRYRADFENLRRRTQLEAESLRERLLAELVADLLPVLDDMERALAAAGGEEAPPGWLAGFELIYRRFLAVLGARGVVRLAAVGQPFDPEKHEAIARVEDSGQPANTVVEELRAGYALGDRIIRPALVKVQV